MLTLEQGFVYAVMIGGIVGLAIGLRKIIVMEQKILNIERNVEKMVGNVATEEDEIEKAISRLKKPRVEEGEETENLP